MPETFRDKVLEVLRNSSTRRISFSFDGIPIPNYGRDSTVTVNYSTFERIAIAIENDRIKPVEISRRCGRIPGSSMRYPGMWDQGRNALFVPYPVTRGEESTLIHEAVHASFTLTQSSNQMWRGDEEAAAYIAKHLYQIITGFPYSYSSPFPHNNEIHRIAR